MFFLCYINIVVFYSSEGRIEVVSCLVFPFPTFIHIAFSWERNSFLSQGV